MVFLCIGYAVFEIGDPAFHLFKLMTCKCKYITALFWVIKALLYSKDSLPNSNRQIYRNKSLKLAHTVERKQYPMRAVNLEKGKQIIYYEQYF